jgi:hypothetical protein
LIIGFQAACYSCEEVLVAYIKFKDCTPCL